MIPDRDERPEDVPAMLVVGVGNLLLGDEGFGVHVARALLARRDRWPEGLEVIEAGTALLDVADQLAERPHLVVVDAMRLGRAPGTRYRLELPPGAPRAREAPAAQSLHSWSVLDTLDVLARLGRGPWRVTVLGAEPEVIAPGLELSAAVARAAAETVEGLLGSAEQAVGRASRAGEDRGRAREPHAEHDAPRYAAPRPEPGTEETR